MKAQSQEFDIRAITPIKSNMTSEERREAIKSFLSEYLTPEYELKKSDISGGRQRQCGARGFSTYALRDGSEWVMGTGGLNRFLGHL
jgi:hypothetical protein